MVQIPVLYRTKDFQNSTNKKCLPLVLTYYLKQYRHRQPNPESHSTMTVQIRLPMSVPG